MSKLSPAAQAVLDAFNQEKGWLFPVEIVGSKVAAALRATADQVVPVEPYYENCDVVREEILAIADELEGAQ